jgi:hypothetical protein
MQHESSNKHARPGFARAARTLAFTCLFALGGPGLAFGQASPAPAKAPAPTAAPAPTKAPAPATAPAPAPAPAKTEPAKATKAEPATTAAPAAGAGTAAATTSAEGAPAGPTDAEREAARTAFEAGMAAHAAGDFVTAATEFKKAQDAIPSPFAEYWLANSLDKADPEQKSPKGTVEAYELFVTNPGAKHVGADKVDEAVARIKALRALLPATLMVVTSPAGAAVTINGEKQAGVTPLTVERPAGAYHVEATVEGYDPLAVDVTLEGGITLEQQMNLVKTPPPPPTEATPAAEPKKRSMVPAYVTAGVAGASLIVGTVFGILALDAQSRFNENPSSDLADEQERNALICDMALGVAVTLGITSVVLFTSREDGTTGRAKAPAVASTKRGLSLTPYASTTGGGARARLVF